MSQLVSSKHPEKTVFLPNGFRLPSVKLRSVIDVHFLVIAVVVLLPLLPAMALVNLVTSLAADDSSWKRFVNSIKK